MAEREEISRSIVAGQSLRSISRRIGRAPSTVSRELRRNGGHLSYRANQADLQAWERARCPKECKLVRNWELARVVASKLRLHWPPEQIAGWLKHPYAVNRDYLVSHETIYRSLYIQARGALKKELLEHLRRWRAMRRSRHHTMKTEDHGRICDVVSISERPATADDRAVPSHWERDLLFGSANSQIATLVERQTRYVMLIKIARKDTATVIDALIEQAHKLPRELYKSLTWDRGKELADHQRFTIATDISVAPPFMWMILKNDYLLARLTYLSITSFLACGLTAVLFHNLMKLYAQVREKLRSVVKERFYDRSP